MLTLRGQHTNVVCYYAYTIPTPNMHLYGHYENICVAETAQFHVPYSECKLHNRLCYTDTAPSSNAPELHTK